ncbi:MAG: PaaI family thioesterase [Steroidobacteraceae bacterium]
MSTPVGPTLAELQQRLDDCPFHKLFSMTILHADAESQTLAIRLAFTPAVERKAGTKQYHGGVIASLIDIAGDFALIAVLGHGVPTINFRVDYLRPAVATDLIARAQVRRAGRSVGVVDIDVEDQDGRVVAIGRGCYGTRAG